MSGAVRGQSALQCETPSQKRVSTLRNCEYVEINNKNKWIRLIQLPRRRCPWLSWGDLRPSSEYPFAAPLGTVSLGRVDVASLLLPFSRSW